MKVNKKGSFELSNLQVYNEKRKIPFRIILKIWISKPLTYAGIIFFLMFLPFVLGLVSFSSLFSSTFSEKDPIVIGVIVESVPTSSYVNDIKVYEYKYQYKIDGNIYSGIGYSTGDIKNIGEEIRIYYKEGKPDKSKAIDLRSSEFGLGSLFAFVFPFLGLLIIFFGTRQALKQVRILQYGFLAEGKLIAKEEAGTENPIYRMTFEFTAHDSKTYKIVTETSRYYLLEDEEFEKLVYDPLNPSKAVLLDDLPKGIKTFFLSLG